MSFVGNVEEFIKENYEFQDSITLSTTELNLPPKINKDIEIRKIKTDEEWNEVVELQILCADDVYKEGEYRKFKVEQMKNHRKMSDNGRGHWFGAFLKDKIVADLGIFFDREQYLGRYQSVGTHPDFRRRGICGTLVYEAGKSIMSEYGVQRLVMNADPNYHAAKIYESVGFSGKEMYFGVCWWPGKK